MALDKDRLEGWFSGRLPDDWFDGPPGVTVDRDEILVVGKLKAPDVGEASDAARREAELSRIEGWREETRRKRMEIASQAQHRFRRKVSWGAEAGETRRLFTTLGAPVMTRLRMAER